MIQNILSKRGFFFFFFLGGGGGCGGGEDYLNQTSNVLINILQFKNEYTENMIITSELVLTETAL